MDIETDHRVSGTMSWICNSQLIRQLKRRQTEYRSQHFRAEVHRKKASKHVTGKARGLNLLANHRRPHFKMNFNISLSFFLSLSLCLSLSHSLTLSLSPLSSLLSLSRSLSPSLCVCVPSSWLQSSKLIFGYL